MSYFNKFDKKEKTIGRTVEVDDRFYTILEKLSKETYDASINKLVNAAIEKLVETENIKTYDQTNSTKIVRTFLIRSSLMNSLKDLRKKYKIPVYLLINIAIRNALVDEGLIK
ncbi:MAG: hypothetical protein Q4G09_00555 [Clostridia bacterium]|nr:hypothetical protein [Clostridia bacterium]